MIVKFYAPSYKRPYKSLTQINYPYVKLVVKESEAAAYRKGGNDIVVCPDSAQGKCARVRNWMLNNLQDDCDCMVMMDDDVMAINRWNDGELEKLNPDDLEEFAERGAIMANDCGVKLWGINPVQDKGAYREHTPFGFVNIAWGPFMGHMKTDLRFDEKFSLKDDIDFALINLYRYRNILRFNAYNYNAKQATIKGGTSEIRNTDREKAEFKMLQDKWGSGIVKYDNSSKRSFDFNPVIKSPYRGV